MPVCALCQGIAAGTTKEVARDMRIGMRGVQHFHYSVAQKLATVCQKHDSGCAKNSKCMPYDFSQTADVENPSIFMIRLLKNLGSYAKNMIRDVPKVPSVCPMIVRNLRMSKTQAFSLFGCSKTWGRGPKT